MNRIFWLECPECKTRWYAEWILRHSEYKMECPNAGCRNKFKADDAAWIDDRESR